jgi:hypothetical protein
MSQPGALEDAVTTGATSFEPVAIPLWLHVERIYENDHEAMVKALVGAVLFARERQRRLADGTDK